MSRAAVTVVIPTLARAALLARAVESLLAGRVLAEEVLLLDQADDGDVEALAQQHAGGGVRRVACPRRGISAATNLGLRLARHEAVLVTHDDCTVAPDWVETGARLAADAPQLVITGQVRPVGDPALVPSCRTDPDPADFTDPGDFGQLYPASMVLPRRAALAFGGFDERFTTAAEDLDFAFRWLRAGRTIRYAPELVVDHHDWRAPEELGALYKRYWRAQGAFYAKHLRARDRAIVPYVRWDLRTADPHHSGKRPALLTGIAAGLRGSAA